MHEAKRSGRTASTTLGSEGAVALQVVLFLPVMVALLAMVVNLGVIFLTKYRLQTAVDLGALAAAQDVDLALLAEGRRVLLDGPAKGDAREVTLANLGRLGGAQARADIIVSVYNPSPQEPDHDAWTGRAIRQPTVCVLARIPMSVWSVTLKGQKAIVEAHADASVLERH